LRGCLRSGWNVPSVSSNTLHHARACTARVENINPRSFSVNFIFNGRKFCIKNLHANCTFIHTHTFNGPFSGTTKVSRYQKGKPIWILLKQETVSGSDISWVICKSAPRSRQITMPAPHHSVFTGRMSFLPPNQQRQSTEGNPLYLHIYI